MTLNNKEFYSLDESAVNVVKSYLANKKKEWEEGIHIQDDRVAFVLFDKGSYEKIPYHDIKAGNIGRLDLIATKFKDKLNYASVLNDPYYIFDSSSLLKTKNMKGATTHWMTTPEELSEAKEMEWKRLLLNDLQNNDSLLALIYVGEEKNRTWDNSKKFFNFLEKSNEYGMTPLYWKNLYAVENMSSYHSSISYEDRKNMFKGLSLKDGNVSFTSSTSVSDEAQREWLGITVLTMAKKIKEGFPVDSTWGKLSTLVLDNCLSDFSSQFSSLMNQPNIREALEVIKKSGLELLKDSQKALDENLIGKEIPSFVEKSIVYDAPYQEDLTFNKESFFNNIPRGFYSTKRESELINIVLDNIKNGIEMGSNCQVKEILIGKNRIVLETVSSETIDLKLLEHISEKVLDGLLSYNTIDDYLKESREKEFTDMIMRITLSYEESKEGTNKIGKAKGLKF